MNMNIPTHRTELLQDELLRAIRQFLSEQLEFDALEELFVTKAADNATPFDAHYDLFFGDVLEKLSWTAEAPSTEERTDGWQNIEEFRIWLGHAYRKASASPGRRDG